MHKVTVYLPLKVWASHDLGASFCVLSPPLSGPSDADQAS